MIEITLMARLLYAMNCHDATRCQPQIKKLPTTKDMLKIFSQNKSLQSERSEMMKRQKRRNDAKEKKLHKRKDI